MARFCVCPKTGLKRGAWSPEEDRILSAFIARHGHLNWRLLPKQAGLARDGKSCRLRWMNYLRPDLKRGNFSKEEDEIIVRMHERLGNRWSAIAHCLPGRTDNEIKNHWHTRLEKISTQNVALEQSIESSSITIKSSSLTSPPLCLGNNPLSPQNSVLVAEGCSYDEINIISMEEFSPLEVTLEELLSLGVDVI